MVKSLAIAIPLTMAFECRVVITPQHVLGCIADRLHKDRFNNGIDLVDWN